MAEPLGWIKTEEWEDDQYVSLFVVRHRAGSFEGARHQAREALRSLDEAGVEILASTMGLTNGSGGAMDAVKGFWGIKDAD